MTLPKGFVLEQPAAQPTVNLPAGFKLEQPSSIKLPAGFHLEQKQSIPQKIGSFFEGIGKSASNTIAPISKEISKFRETPLEAAAPLTTMVHRSNLPGVLKIPLSGIAAPIDIFSGIERVGTDAVAGLFGEDPQLSAGERGKRALTEDRFLANRIIQAADKGMQPLVDQAIQAGMDPKEIHNILVARGTLFGTVADVATGEFIVRAFRAPGQIVKAVRIGAEEKARLASALDTRAQQLFERAERDFLKQGGDPNQLRLSAPEPGVRPSPQEPISPMQAGIGFIKEPTGAPFIKKQPVGVQDIMELPPRQVGESVKAPAPSRAGLMREASIAQREANIVKNAQGQPLEINPIQESAAAAVVKKPRRKPKNVIEESAMQLSVEPLPTKLVDPESRWNQLLRDKESLDKSIIQRPPVEGDARITTLETVEAEIRQVRKQRKQKGSIINEDIRNKMTPQEQKLLDTLELAAISPDRSYVAQANKDITALSKSVQTRLQSEKGAIRTSEPAPEPTGGPKGESPVARRAREKIEAAQASKISKVPLLKEPTVGDVVDKKVSSINIRGRGKDIDVTKDIEIELPVTVQETDAVGRAITKTVGGTKVGNTNVGELIQKGQITERQAKILVAAQKANPIIGGKFLQTTRAERIAAIGDPSVRATLKVIEDSSIKSLTALHDTPVSQALAIAKRAIDQNIPIERVMGEISQDLLVARKVAYFLGQNLQAIRRSAATGELAEILEQQLKKRGLTKIQQAEIREALAQLGSKEAKTRFRRSLDMVTEYGINAMLSSPVTFARNLIGSTAGVASQIPVKIAQGFISNIASVLRIPMTERAYFREVGPEIAGIISGFGRGVRKGGRFLKHEDVKRVFEHLETRIKKVAATQIPKGQNFSQLKRDQKARILRELRDDIRDIMTEEEVTRAAELGFTSPTRAIPGKLGEIINIPVRSLVATDKVFQTSSASGHIAARRIRKAIQERTSVRDIRLSADEIDEAKTDAMFYVFREKLGPRLGAVQNLISETPLLPLLIPFFKSTVNFIKFALKNSPFGLIDTIWKSVKKGVLDTKSAARTLSGTAVLFGVNLFFDKNSDTIELHPAAGSQVERELRRESGIGEQVIVFGRNLKDPKRRVITHVEPYANIAPFSDPLNVIALKQEYYRRKAKGERADEAFAKTFNKAMRGVLNNTYFGDVRNAVDAAENMADTSVALDKNGKPEKGLIESIFTGQGAQVVYRKVAGVTVPNIVRDIRLLDDKRILDPKTLFERLRSELPKIGSFDPSKGIPARKTIFGGDATRQQKRLPFNPFAKDKSIDPTMSEMIRLEIFPAKPPKQLSEQGLKIVLTEDEQQQFNFLGKELKHVMDGIVQEPWYKESGDFVQAKILEMIIDNFREVQSKVTKTEGLTRLIQSKEGIEQMLTGVTKGRSFSPFQPSSK